MQDNSLKIAAQAIHFLGSRVYIVTWKHKVK